jgi:hypothetical protein
MEGAYRSRDSEAGNEGSSGGIEVAMTKRDFSKAVAMPREDRFLNLHLSGVGVR